MNIIGEGFSEEIIKQVSIRQIAHGMGYLNQRNTNNQLYKNANTAWCRLVSSTEITNPKQLVNSNIPLLGYNGDELARKFILFNGTTDDSLTNSRYGYGFGKGDYAYTSWGKLNPSVDFGFKPMAGITSVSVKSKNQGCIRTATVNIKAWDKMSFEIIDVLYLRIGFSVLLEWGHSMYYDNNYDLITDPIDNNLTNEFLNGNSTYYDFLKLIQNKRLNTYGNYDALFGKVTNFHWSYQPDGSYDITLNLISAGDIVESFKIKGNTTTVTEEMNKYKDTEPVGLDYYDIDRVMTTYASTNDITAYLFQRWNDLNAKGTHATTTKTWSTDGITRNYVLTYKDANGKKVGEVVRVYPDKDEPGTPTNYFIRLGDLLNFIQKNVLYKIKGKNTSEKSQFLYIDTDTETNLMHAHSQLMSYDPRVCMVRRYVVFPKWKVPTKEEQEEAIKKEEEYSKENPNKYKYDPTIIDQNYENFDPNLPIPFNVDGTRKITREELDTYNKSQEAKLAEMNQEPVTLPPGQDGTFDREFFDPSVEYFAHPYGGKDEDFTDSDNINKFMHDKLNDVGKIMNIYINYRFIITKLQELSDVDTNSVTLYAFLKELVSNINGAFGGYSKLDLWIDETTNTLKIIDQNPLPSSRGALAALGKQTKTAFFDLNSYTKTKLKRKDEEGKDIEVTLAHSGFIRDFRFDTELTPEYSTIIQVSSTSQGNVVGENNTALSKINKGLKDRFKEEIIGGGKTASKPDLYTTYQEATAEWQDFSKNLNKFLGHIYDNVYIPDEIESSKGKFTVLQKLYKKYLKARQDYLGTKPDKTQQDNLDAGTGFIPFNLSLTMDGLSGMKIYQRFNIDSSYLPSNYPNVVDFVIKSLDHEIKDNQWTTTVQSMCIAKGNEFSYKALDLTPAAIRSATEDGADISNVDPGELSKPGDYGVDDLPLFLYLLHQQGPGGAPQHYSLYIGDGKFKKYQIRPENVYANWPGRTLVDKSLYNAGKAVKYKYDGKMYYATNGSRYHAKNGVKLEDIPALWNTNPRKVAHAFIDVWRQALAAKLKSFKDKLDSNRTTLDGTKYSDIKAAFQKYTPNGEITYDRLAAIAQIENGLELVTDAKLIIVKDEKGKKIGSYYVDESELVYVTMFQLNKTYSSYQNKVLKYLDHKFINVIEDGKTVRKEYYGPIDTLTQHYVPLLAEEWEEFAKKTGFVTGAEPKAYTPPPESAAPASTGTDRVDNTTNNVLSKPTKSPVTTVRGWYDLNTLTADFGDGKTVAISPSAGANCDALHAFQGNGGNTPVGNIAGAVYDALADLKTKNPTIKYKAQEVQISIEEIKDSTSSTGYKPFPKIYWEVNIWESDDDKHWRGFAVRGAGCNVSIYDRWNSVTAGNDTLNIEMKANSLYSTMVTKVQLIADITYDPGVNSSPFYGKGNKNNAFKEGFYIWTDE